MGKQWKQCQTLCFGAPKSLQMVTVAVKLKDAYSLEEYMEELYKKDLHDPDNHDDVITNLEPDILEREVKWALASLRKKLVEVMEFQLSCFKS